MVRGQPGRIEREIRNAELTCDDVPDPLAPGVFLISGLEFPADTPYPSILQRVDGVPVYTMTSDGASDEIWVTTPDLWLALRLGARVTCDRGWFLNVITDVRTGAPSRSIAYAVSQLVNDRGLAKNEYGGRVAAGAAPEGCREFRLR